MKKGRLKGGPHQVRLKPDTTYDYAVPPRSIAGRIGSE
jgi:hypothetical protein